MVGCRPESKLNKRSALTWNMPVLGATLLEAIQLPLYDANAFL
jgi:hypothetical protein